MAGATIKYIDMSPTYNSKLFSDMRKKTFKYMARLLMFARHFCPIKTGALRESLHLKTTSRIGTVSNMEIELDAHMPYAYYVEYGTSSMPSRPFIRPAYDLVKLEAEWSRTFLLSGIHGHVGANWNNY